MNRIDRLFHILLILQRRKLVRAVDLAAEFEVSTRTIYRDLLALGEMGVPLAAMPGEGYALVEGFYLPPLRFNGDEAKALLLGARMLSAQSTGELAKAAEVASEKITHILPETTRTEAEGLTRIIQFYLPPRRFDLDHPYLVQLQHAIQAYHPVRLRYHSLKDNAVTERVIEPHSLTYGEGAWYVVGYCRLRQDERSFRLQRINHLEVLNETFTPRSIPAADNRTISVRVRFTQSVVRWVRERQHYAFRGEEAVPNSGHVIMCYEVEALTEIQSWLFGWGIQAETLSPPELRQALREEAKKLAALLT
jgi:predicted DNA-binding transcriptional regulator YafY